MSSGWSTRRPAAGSAAQRGYGQQWREVRLLVLARDGWTCRLRGCDLQALPPRERQVDHVQPLASGGSRLDAANMRAACGRCNRRRGAQLGRQRQQQAKQRRLAYRVW